MATHSKTGPFTVKDCKLAAITPAGTRRTCATISISNRERQNAGFT